MATDLYQAYFCEENAWHLAERLAGLEAYVVLLRGAGPAFLMWEQKASAPGEPIFWDYHVVAVTKSGGWQVWDPDSRLGSPSPAAVYWPRSFKHLGDAGAAEGAPAAALSPRFIVIAGADYLGVFASDRRHMRHADGRWKQLPPPWAPLRGPASDSAFNLDALLRGELVGDTLDYEQLCHLMEIDDAS